MTNINLSQRTVFGIVALLVLVTVTCFLFALSQWHEDWSLTHKKSKNETVSTENQTAKLTASIPNAHLFGQTLANTNDAPLSNLQFKVTGIVKVSNGKNNEVSKAYISVNGEAAKIVEIGDSLPYGVKVYDITADTVMLENDGHLEKLLLPREQLTFKPAEPVGSQ